MMRWLITDIATAPIDGAAGYIEDVSAPSNYKDEAKIAAYVAEKRAEALERCALDPDLGRITAIGIYKQDSEPWVLLCRTEEDERKALASLSSEFAEYTLVGYNALKFDWPYLMRRASYLGVRLHINTDRYKTASVDVAERLTHRGLLPMRSLAFYIKRHGWTDLVKPLTGAEEARVIETERWADLAASVEHDLIATARIAEWIGLIARAEALV